MSIFIGAGRAQLYVVLGRWYDPSMDRYTYTGIRFAWCGVKRFQIGMRTEQWRAFG